MEIVKSLWEQLQKSKTEYKQLSVEEIKKAMGDIFEERKEPTNWIPAWFVLDMGNEEFKLFMKSRNNWKITCNAEQYELLQIKIKQNG